MNWKIKALLQNMISYLPSETSYSLHYFLQRKIGGLKTSNPVNELNKGIDICKEIKKQNQNIKNKVFFEIGTGRIALAPLAYWLMGAEKIITVDLNPYLKDELIIENLDFISNNEDKIYHLFGNLLNEKRWEKLLIFINTGNIKVSDYLNLCQITYLAPADASKIKMPDKSVDFHTSSTVFEHIPRKVLKDIIAEGNRLIKTNGLFIHDIDYSDHFSHSDKRISAINFLQFSHSKWLKYAGNKYMYMNRLRHDDFLEIFNDAGHEILNTRINIDNHSKNLLQKNSISLDEKFKDKTIETLSISRSWIVSKKLN